MKTHVLVLTPVSLLLAACSQGGQGSCQLSNLSGTDAARYVQNADAVRGGYLTLSLEGSQSKQCTVHVQSIAGSAGAPRLKLTLAAHCFGFNASAITSSELALYNPSSGKYFKVPVLLDVSKNAAAAREAMNASGLSSAQADLAIRTFFSPTLAQESDANCIANGKTNGSSEDLLDGSAGQVLCFDSNDTATLIGTAELASLGNQQESVKRLLQATEQPPAVSSSGLTGVLKAAHAYSQSENDRAELLQAYKKARFVSFVSFGCDSDQKEVEYFKSLRESFCSVSGDLQKLRDSLRPHLKIRDKDPIEFLSQLGFSKTSLPAEALLVQNFLDAGKLWENRKALLEMLSGSAGSWLSVLNNVQLNNRSPRFVNVSGFKDTLSSTSDRVVLGLPAATEGTSGPPEFGRTDSGSILLVGAIFPIGVLSTVDGNPVSGGASVIPIDFETDGLASPTAERQRGETVSPENPSGFESAVNDRYAEPYPESSPLETDAGSPPQASGKLPAANRPDPYESPSELPQDEPNDGIRSAARLPQGDENSAGCY